MRKCEATFDSYWNDREFMQYEGEKEEDQRRLKLALSKKESKSDQDYHFIFDIQPYFYQKEILEKLQVEREVYGRTKNLLVTATGVGKTVISAFDYKRYRLHSKNSARLLFVAHREEFIY